MVSRLDLQYNYIYIIYYIIIFEAKKNNERDMWNMNLFVKRGSEKQKRADATTPHKASASCIFVKYSTNIITIYYVLRLRLVRWNQDVLFLYILFSFSFLFIYIHTYILIKLIEKRKQQKANSNQSKTRRIPWLFYNQGNQNVVVSVVVVLIMTTRETTFSFPSQRISIVPNVGNNFLQKKKIMIFCCSHF